MKEKYISFTNNTTKKKEKSSISKDSRFKSRPLLSLEKKEKIPTIIPAESKALN